MTAKRVGLALSELDTFTLDDFTSFVEMWVGDDDDGYRSATQDDINSILG